MTVADKSATGPEGPGAWGEGFGGGRNGGSCEQSPTALRQRRTKGFARTWVGQVELSAPPADVLLSDGGYARARLLVRVGGEPLGFVEVDAPGRVLGGALIRETAVRELGPLLAARTGRTGGDAGVPGGDGAAPAPAVSVVVCSRERSDVLRECLVALGRLDLSEVEILVVDSAPVTSRTADLLGRWPDARVRYVREDERGLSAARNRGLREASNEVVAFTDDDVRVDPGWLRGLIGGFARGPEVACATGLVVAAELETPSQVLASRAAVTASPAPSRSPSGEALWGVGLERRFFEAHAGPGESPLHPFTAGMFGVGASFAVVRSEAERLGGFDPLLGAGSAARGGEDLDFFLRVVLAGRAIAYEPRSLAWHVHQRGAAELRRQAFSYGSGLAAYGVKLLADPGTRRQVLRRARPALGRLLRDRIGDGLGVPAPADLRAIEMVGFAWGALSATRTRLGRRGAR